MSSLDIRAALEGALAVASPLPTAWENFPFSAPLNEPYQRATLMPARPMMLDANWNLHREQGFLQVNLCYPLEGGSSPAQARAVALQEAFFAGRSILAGSNIVVIDGTPYVAPGLVEDTLYTIPVRIFYYANIKPEHAS